MEYVQMFLSHPLGQATATGLTGAIAVDLAVFLKSKEPGEWWKQFSASVALWRWAQGAVGGFFGGLGINAAV